MTSRAYRREERWRSGRSGEIRKERGEQMGGTCHNDKPGLKKKIDAAWVRSRAERPSVSYTKVTWTGHKLQVTNKFKQQISGSNKFQKRGGRGR